MACLAVVSIRKSLVAPRSKPIISLFITRDQTNTSSSSSSSSSSVITTSWIGQSNILTVKPTSVSQSYLSSPVDTKNSENDKTKKMSSTTTGSNRNENTVPTTTDGTTADGNKFVIFALAGSQFVFKVLAAIESRKVDHYVELVSLDTKERAKILNRKDGKASVPVLCNIQNDSSLFEQIEDSEDILHWLDQNYGTNFFPSDDTTAAAAASEVSVRASDKTLAAMVWYYNWVDYTGYTKSMKVSVAKFVPLSSILPTFVLDLFVKSTRDKFRYQVKKVLGIENDSVLDDEKQMRSKLVEELKYFQSLLVDDEQVYLIPNTKEPTAADFSVYAQLERLVGEALTASDYDIQPSMLELKYSEPTKDSLARLWKWHDNIRTKFPVHFKGKRPPKDILEKIQQQQQQQQKQATQSKL